MQFLIGSPKTTIPAGLAGEAVMLTTSVVTSAGSMVRAVAAVETECMGIFAFLALLPTP